jgi:CIC family chloride channel protein
VTTPPPDRIPLQPRVVARLSHLGKWVGLSSLVGFLSGVAAVLFDRLLEGLRGLGFEHLLGHTREGLGPLDGRAWWILLLLPLGGLLVGILTQRLAPEAKGHGTEQMIRCFHTLKGKVRRRVVGVKAVASALTIASGGSGGTEGPVAQIGSGIGSSVSDLMNLSDRDRRMFLLAGTSAGIGALFCAPLGAALFAPEVLYRKPEFEGDAIIPCIVSSIVAYTTFASVNGVHHKVAIPAAIHERLSLHDPRELLIYLALALLCAAASWFYVRFFERTTQVFDRLRVPGEVKPAIGGLLLGLLAVLLATRTGADGVLFGGYHLMEDAIAGSIPIGLLAVLALSKIVATSLSIGSGGSGGVFAPSLAIGALLGALVGQTGAVLFPTLDIQASCYALVGMGGFFAGVANTPIAAIVIVCEITGSYQLLAPLMLVAVVHMLLANRWSIYETQVNGLVDSPVHAGDFVVDVLEELRVEDLMDGQQPVNTVHETTTLREALDFIAHADGYYFPVVDGEERMVGIFSLSDVRRIFRESEVEGLVIVRDFMVEKVISVKPGDAITSALAKLNGHGLHEIPVVAADDPRRVLGMLTRQRISATYQDRVRELRSSD